MAPCGRRRRRRTISTRSCKKLENQEINTSPSSVLMKKKKKKKNSEEVGENISSTMTNNITSFEACNNNGCSTPKGKKFRIPRINKCPPAPMKIRSTTSSPSLVSSLKRTPIAFFAPPDLELFFFFASDDLHQTDNTIV